jgi:hypothetical protein
VCAYTTRVIIGTKQDGVRVDITGYVPMKTADVIEGSPAGHEHLAGSVAAMPDLRLEEIDVAGFTDLDRRDRAGRIIPVATALQVGDVDSREIERRLGHRDYQ